MKCLINLILILLTINGYSEIYDCFLFFNELEILDIRLHEMYNHVDKFVIVESVETFRGNLKPLYYQENYERYEQFKDKIIHVILEERLETNNPWVREKFQRNQIMRGLRDCQPSDIVLISDVDEIVRGSVISNINQILLEGAESVVCDQPMYKFYLNTRDYGCNWMGTCGTTFEHLMHISPEDLRMNRHDGDDNPLYKMILNAGWHFTNMGGLKNFIQKTEAFSHQEADLPENKTTQFITRYLVKNCKIVPLDNTFPAYILENQDYFHTIGFLYEGIINKGLNRRCNIFRHRHLY